MRFFRLLLCALTVAVFATARVHAQTNYTTQVTLANLLSGGSPVSSASVCATPSDMYGNPIVVSAPTWGLLIPSRPLCATVTNGALSAGLNVPDANHTNAAAPIRYNFTIQVLNGSGIPTGTPVILSAVPNVSGSTYALDNYTTTVSAVTPSNAIATGPGVPSTCSGSSLDIETASGGLYYCAAGSYHLLAARTFTLRGLWASGTTYAAYDVVNFNGSSYASITAGNTGNQPDTHPSNWQLLAAASTSSGASSATVSAAAAVYGADIYSVLGMGQRNLLNPAMTMTVGYDINSVDGSLLSVGSYVEATDFIPVAGVSSIVASHDMVANPTGGVVCYDASKTFVGPVVTGRVNAGTAVSLPAGCIYLRTSFTGGLPLSATSGLYTGTTLPGSFIPYGYNYPDAAYVAAVRTEIGNTPSAYTFAQFERALSVDASAQPLIRNLIDPARYQAGVAYDSLAIQNNISPVVHSGFCCSGWSGLIPVVAGQTYTIEGQPSPNNSTTWGMVFFDINGQPITSSYVSVAAMTLNQQITAPANAAYVGIPINSTYLNSVMLIPGTTIVPQYIPFAQTPSTVQNRSPWNLKKVAVIGDSYCVANQWQQYLVQQHGATLMYQNCIVGRPISQIFDCYGGSATGTNGGASITPPYNSQTCAHPYTNGNDQDGNSGTTGNTLAQDLAGADLVIVELGTNDHTDPTLGSIADTYTTASTYGYIQAALRGLQSILPAQTRIVWISPIQVSSTTANRAAMMGPISQAIDDVTRLYGVPFIDNFHNSGFSLLNDGTLLQSDGIHPTGSPIFTNGPTGFQLFARYPTLQLNVIPPLD